MVAFLCWSLTCINMMDKHCALALNEFLVYKDKRLVDSSYLLLIGEGPRVTRPISVAINQLMLLYLNRTWLDLDIQSNKCHASNKEAQCVHHGPAPTKICLKWIRIIDVWWLAPTSFLMLLKSGVKLLHGGRSQLWEWKGYVQQRSGFEWITVFVLGMRWNYLDLVI